MKISVDDQRKKALKEQNWKMFIYFYIIKNQNSEEMLLKGKEKNHWTCNVI